MTDIKLPEVLHLCTQCEYSARCSEKEWRKHLATHHDKNGFKDGLTHIVHKIKPRPWGYEAVLTIYNNGDPVEGFTPCWKTNPTHEQINEVIASIKNRIQTRLDYEAVRSIVFDSLGPEIKEAIFWLIQKIRQYPTATLAQAKTQWDAVWADSLFTFNKLVAYVQKLAGNITWNQFKTYVINHKFGEVD